MTRPTETSSLDALIKMAHTAARNSTLLAAFIEDQCQQKNVTWAQIAVELQISELQLAKLALCRQPRNRHFKSDVAWAARYAKMDAQKLTDFLQSDNKQNVTKKSFWQIILPWPNRTGDQSMIVKRAVAFGVALIAIFFISAFIFSQATGAEATLQVTNGEVVVQQMALFGQTTTVIVSSGETVTLSSKDTIEIPADADAVLYLFEGSTVELSANTLLELTELADNGSDHQIYVTLFNGRIINRVTKLLGVDDAYEVRTPSSTASVRGTIFSVAVIDQLSSQIVVTEGVVEVSLGSELAQVQAGEMVTAVSGQPLNIEPINSPDLLPPPAPAQAPTEATTGQSSEDSSAAPGEDTATPLPSDTVNPTTTTTESPAGTTASPALPTNTVRGTQPPDSLATASPPANATTAPALPTSTGGSTQPPGSSATPLSPTNTPRPSVAPTNTPVPIAPTNTPIPVVPTNTPVPIVPTNTPVPPTNTPVPPPPTEEPAQVTICHNPGPNQQTIQVDASAVQGHLNHGDYLGACN